MIGIAALVFKQDEARAHAAFKQVRELADTNRIHLETATLGVRQESGAFKMEEAASWSDATISTWNRFWHRSVHRQEAHEHDSEFVQELGDHLSQGDAGVFVAFEIRFRSENLAELNRLGGEVIVNELTREQRDVMLAEIHEDELNAEKKAYKKMEKGELIDKAAEGGIQNIE